MVLILLAVFGSLRWGELAQLANFTGPEADSLVFVGPKNAPLRRSNFTRAWRHATGSAVPTGGTPEITSPPRVTVVACRSPRLMAC